MPQNPPISRVVYILLGLFLGSLGIHNFVAKRTGVAVAQLLITLLSLFTLAFISGIWALIDICTVTKDGEGRSFS